MTLTLRPQITRRLAALLAAICATIALGANPVPAAAAPARGDIPDSATYLTFTAAHYKVEYIEGWGRLTHGNTTTFADKDSLEQLVLVATPHGKLETFVRGPELAALRRAHATKIGSLRAVRLPGGSGWYLHYTILSAADPVTGKIVPLLADRYYLAGPRQLAIVTLASPVGDDNVDAFRRIAHSFSWR